MRLTLVLANTLVGLAGAAQARPLALSDLWRLEAVRGARPVADGRRILLETAAAYDQAGAFDDLALIQLELGRLHLIDPRAARPKARPVSPGAGLVELGNSPSGRRLAIGRLEHRELRLGVLELLSGHVRWTGVAVLPPRNGPSVAWLSEQRMVALTPLMNASRTTFPTSAPAQAHLQEARMAQAQGSLGAPRRYGSGMFSAPTPADAALVQVDLQTGGRRRLATGAFDDLAVSANGRYVAVTGPADPPPLASRLPITIADVLPLRRLTIVDLATGAVSRPCRPCDLAPTVLAWSDTSPQLLIFQRSDAGQAWEDGRYTVVDAALGDSRILALQGWTPDVPRRPATFFPVAEGGWRNGAPVLRLKSTARPKPAFYRVGESGPQPTSWRPDAPSGGGVRSQVADDPGRRHARAPTGSDGLVLARAPGAALIEARDAHGVMRLSLERGGVDTPLLALNTHLADVTPVSFRRLSRIASTGAPVIDRLYLPQEAGPGGSRVPVIVAPYPGANAPEQPEYERLGSPPPEINPQLLVARGYAVLVPALPRLPDDEPAMRTTQDVEAALDAALATGLIDPGRAALWGQSFGGYAVLSVAARSTRFRAVIAQSAPTDLFSLYGAFPGEVRARPELIAARDFMLGYVEAGQGGMGRPPWMDPARYLRNSPVFDAVHITASVLLVDGGQDFFEEGQQEEMFTALRRLDKNAQLVVFPGDGHTLTSPANQKAYLDAAITFLDRALDPRAIRP